MGRDEMAQKLFSRLDDQAMQAEDLFLLGSGLIRQDRAEPAMVVLEKARTLDRFHAETLEELTRLYARLKRMGAATEVASQLAAVPGWEARGNVILGALKQERFDAAGASASLANALRIDPLLRRAPASPAMIRKLLGRTLLQLHQPDQAKTQLEAVLSDGSDPEASWLLSRAYLLSGDVAKATQFLSLAGEYGNDDPLHVEPASYVGAKVCEQCHQAIYRTQQNSRHSRTLVLPKDLVELPLPKQPIADSAMPNLTHSFCHEGGTIQLVTRLGDEVRSAIVEYALGSDHHGQTMIGRDKTGKARVFRISMFDHHRIWDLTPNVPPPRTADPGEVIGQYLSPDDLEKCVNCHLTSVRAVSDRSVPEAADKGIGCERCHGPGGNHLAAVAARFNDLAIARPKLASAAQINQLCATCHNSDDPSLPETDPRIIRFQTLTMPRSRCYTESAGGLSCLTCHDPHRDAETSIAHYEAQCLSCHTAAPTEKPRAKQRAIPVERASRTTCPVNSTNNCLKCHMPATPSLVHHTEFTDHHIRIHRPTDTDRRP
jgi:hypothetical protein